MENLENYKTYQSAGSIALGDLKLGCPLDDLGHARYPRGTFRLADVNMGQFTIWSSFNCIKVESMPAL